MLDSINTSIEADSTQEEEQLRKDKDVLQNYSQHKEREIAQCIDNLPTEIEHHKEVNLSQSTLTAFYQAQLKSNQRTEEEGSIKILEENTHALTVKICQLSSKLEQEQKAMRELIEQKDSMLTMLTEKELELIQLKSSIERSSTKHTQACSSNELRDSYTELEQEYDQYKQTKEEQFEVFRKENEAMRSNEGALLNQVDDLEYENTCLKEEIQLYEIEKDQFVFQIKSLADAQNSKFLYQNEIVMLQAQIRDLTEAKERMAEEMSTVKKNALTEKIECDEFKSQLKREKEELNEQLTALKKEMRQEHDAFKKEMAVKNKVIDQLQEIFDKNDEKINQMEAALKGAEQQIQHENRMLLEEKNRNDKEKTKSSLALSDVCSKKDSEINTLRLKVRELMHQLEEHSLLSINKPSNGRIRRCSTLDYAIAEEETHLVNELFAKNKLIDSLIKEKQSYESFINDLKHSTSKANADRLAAEKSYLEKAVCSLKSQMDTIKAQKARDDLRYEAELKDSINESIQLKFQFASTVLEHDKAQLKARKTIKLLKSKMQSLIISNESPESKAQLISN